MSERASESPSGGELEASVVRVWNVSAAPAGGFVERAERLLSTAEREQAGRIGLAAARARFVTARGALRAALSDRLGVGPNEIDVVRTSRGKPEARLAGRSCPLRFSVSHSRQIAVIALALEREIGIDVERVRLPLLADRILQRVLSEHVCTVFRALPAEDREPAFVQAWTQHEAWVKAAGLGVFDPDPLPLQWPPPSGIVMYDDVGGAGTWSFWSFRPLDDHVATVVARGRIERIDVCSGWPGEAEAVTSAAPRGQ